MKAKYSFILCVLFLCSCRQTNSDFYKTIDSVSVDSVYAYEEIGNNTAFNCKAVIVVSPFCVSKKLFIMS